jgi:PAS domain S-box-containing protein
MNKHMNGNSTHSKIKTKLRQQAEDQALQETAQPSATCDTLSPEETSRMIHELQVNQLELEMQNEELRRVQIELDRSRARYFDLYDLAPVGYCTLTEQGVFLEANRTACILLGVNRNALIGQRISQFIHQEDQDTYYLHKKELVGMGSLQSFELRMVRSDTTVFSVDMMALVDQEPEGVSVHRITLRDITQQKLMEDALRYRLAIEELIARISTRFVGISEEEIDGQIEEAIREIAQFAKVKRARVVLNSEDGKKCFKVYEWSSDNTKDIKREVEGQSVHNGPWLLSRLKTGKAIIIPSVDDLPEEARQEREIWKRLFVNSFVAIPLVRGKTIFGYLGLDGEQPGKSWQEEDIRLLRLIGEILINVLQLQEVKKKKGLLQAQLKKQYSLDNVVGKHEKMEHLFRLVHKVAPENTTVMLYGETGVGKERIARAIHQLSPRSAAPMYAINCAAIPDHLLESELFGYERGAFTGAHSTKKGILEEASGSTLFFDEIGDLNRPLQAKILRMLQEREIQRLGGKNRIRVDVRVISATHQDLVKMIADGSFREDLYYRLNTFPIIIPPLRERRADIPLLVNHFLQKYKKETEPRAKKMSSQALQTLLAYPWPGNVRELESVIERAVILAEGEMINQEDLLQEILHTAINQPASCAIDIPDRGLNLKELEKYLLARALEKSGGIIAQAARLLGLSYRTMQYRMIKFGLTCTK